MDNKVPGVGRPIKLARKLRDIAASKAASNIISQTSSYYDTGAKFWQQSLTYQISCFHTLYVGVWFVFAYKKKHKETFFSRFMSQKIKLEHIKYSRMLHMKYNRTRTNKQTKHTYVSLSNNSTDTRERRPSEWMYQRVSEAVAVVLVLESLWLITLLKVSFDHIRKKSFAHIFRP